MHMDYNTEQTMRRRQQNILDAQKQRLYRRAHGIEDMNAEEESGVDVRGLVPWDDGLTRKEREAGGRSRELETKMIQGMVARDEDGEMKEVREDVRRSYGMEKSVEVIVGEPGQEREEQPVQQQRKRKPKWLGIWG